LGQLTPDRWRGRFHPSVDCRLPVPLIGGLPQET
jgi:hypothetical protein